VAVSIKSIEVLRLALPPLENPTAPRRTACAQTASAPLPIHVYAEFPRIRGKQPGDVADEMWVRITADDGNVGYGHTHWGAFVVPILE
jgi:L-rhamnonate dehydratase